MNLTYRGLLVIALLSQSCGGASSAARHPVALEKSEPAYCDPGRFKAHEVQAPGVDVERMHAYRIGEVVLAGLAIGNSSEAQVRKLAGAFSKAGPEAGYCTWYYNVKNAAAAKVFNYHPVEAHPKDLDPDEARELFLKLVGPNFDQDAVNQVMCAERYGYVAMGCDGQKHRGPTAFAMLLAFSGCYPEHAAEIANEVWGLNGIPASVRLSVAEAGYELGSKHAEARKRLQAKLGEGGQAESGPEQSSPD